MLRNWVEANRELTRAYARAGYQRRKDAFKKQAREWKRKNPEKHSRIMCIQNARRRARKAGVGGGGITSAQWKELVRLANGVCAYCLLSEARSADHFVPLSAGGLDAVTNILPACISCNSRKGAKRPDVWIAKTFGSERLAAVLEKWSHLR